MLKEVATIVSLISLLSAGELFAATPWQWTNFDRSVASSRLIWGSGPEDLWVFGYNEEFSRFDGYTFANVSFDHERSLHVKAVDAGGPNNIWTVGFGGRALHFDGSSWNEYNLGNFIDFNDVWVDSSGAAFAVADEGRILHKVIGGAWEQQPRPSLEDVTRVWGVSPTDVYAIRGGELIHWDGSTWSGSGREASRLCGFAANDIWVKDFTAGMIHFDGSVWTDIATIYGIDEIYCVDPQGELLLADQTLLSRLEGSSATLIAELPNWVTDLWDDGNGRLYVSTSGGGLFFLENGEITRLTYGGEILDRPRFWTSLADAFWSSSGELLASGTHAGGPGLASYLDGEWIAAPGDTSLGVNTRAGVSSLWIGDDGEAFAAGAGMLHRVQGQWQVETSASPDFAHFSTVMGSSDGTALATKNERVFRRGDDVWRLDSLIAGGCQLWLSGASDGYVGDSCPGNGGWGLWSRIEDVWFYDDQPFYEVFDIWGTGPDDVYVSNTPGSQHFDGTQWSWFSFDAAGLSRVRYIGANSWVGHGYGTLFYDDGEWSTLASTQSSIAELSDGSGNHYLFSYDERFYQLGCPSLPGGAWWGGSQLDTFADIEIDGPMVYVAGTLGSWGSIGGNDAHIVAYRRGERLWNRAYGNTGEDRIYDIEPTSDGGLIAVGRQQLANGNHQAWVIKVDKSGQKQWSKLFGGAGWDVLWAGKQRADGRYVVVGETEGADGEADGWVIELGTDGSLELATTFGGPGEDVLKDFAFKGGGGILAVGRTSTNRNDTALLDGWILSLGPSADTFWESRSLGHAYDDGFEAVVKVTDGWVVAGWYGGPGAGPSNTKGWIKGLDSGLRHRFSRYFGGSGEDRFSDIDVDSEGRLVTAGRTTSYSNARQAWLQVSDSDGNRLYSEIYGGAGDDDFQAAAVGCARDSITAVGATDSWGGGSKEAWARTPDYSQVKAWIGSFRNLLQSRGLSGELITITTDPQEDPSFDLIRYLEGTAYLRPIDSFDELYQAASDIIARARPSEDADSDGSLNADDPDPFDSGAP